MRIKSLVTAMIMAGTFGATLATATQQGMLNKAASDLELVASTNIKPIALNKTKSKLKTSQSRAAQKAYFEQNKHTGTDTYIVRLIDEAVPSYRGRIKGMPSSSVTSKKAKLSSVKFDAKSSDSMRYASYLETKQNSFVQKASQLIGSNVEKLRSLKYAVNGIVTKLTYDQAVKLSAMPEVAFVERNKIIPLNTDTGPGFIGAGEIWDGTATGTENMGEGMIIGIIDTGVNTDHDSFAAQGDDGYIVANPWGDGVFVGDCVSDASLCNSKLIGVRSYEDLLTHSIWGEAGFTAPTNGEDHNGHGSHTASTAGGNVLLNVPLTVNDPASGTTGDGIATSTVFPRISGVAPHANIISYQVCLPGDPGDTLSGCFSAGAIGAVDDAIADGVDVINFSIGGTTPFSPWSDATEVGFLNAQAAGIFVAVSAGNSGPDASTITKAAPWYTSVGAVTHGRSTNRAITFNGELYAAQPASVVAFPDGGITAPVVYSGAVDAANFEGCNAFAAGAFNASLALISRGSCAFTDKVNNAANAGALGVIVFNNTGGDELVNMGVDGTTIPSVFIGENSGQAIVADLTTTPGLTAKIDNLTFQIVSGAGDMMADFSSRGPNEFGGIITPQVAAPGVSIYAAYADDKPYGDVNVPDPSDYAFLNGTSMASPHVAGAAALVKQSRPTWNPDQIRSALMMTATTNVVKEDGVTAADGFDMGAGRVRVDLAVNSGLVMSESIDNYLAADPAESGDVSTLNIPSMANYACGGVCSWTRTFTAVKSGTYSFSASSDSISIEPATIDATEGENYSVIISFDLAGQSEGAQLFEEILITSVSSPDLHLPIYVGVANGTVPNDLEITTGRNDGSWVLEGLSTYSTNDFNIVIDGLYDANASGLTEVLPFELSQDPTTGSIAGLLDVEEGGLLHYPLVVPANTVAIKATISDATANDNDLYILSDLDGDGQYTDIAGSQADEETNESVTINSPAAGNYLVVVQNWGASSAESDTGNLTVEIVPLTDPVEGLSVETLSSAAGAVEATLFWNKELAPGDSFFADLTARAGEAEIGTFRVTINRSDDDVALSTDAELVARGEPIDYVLTVKPNTYNQDINYSISVDMPANMSLVEDSVSSSGGNITVKDPNAVGINLVADISAGQDSTIGNGQYNDNLDEVFVYPFEVPSGSLSLTAAISEATSPDFDLWIEYDTVGDGSGWSLVGYAATGETNEIATISAPEAGNYRAIVQNYDDSSEGAIDTGKLTVTTVPAAGEGFIFEVTSQAPYHSYSVVTAADDAECAQAGLNYWASGNYEYVPLSAFGIPTAGFSYDEDLLYANSSSTYTHFGREYSGVRISDNGFVTFDESAGSNAWNNVSIPNSAIPNNFVAGLWADQVIVDDGTRGLRLASLGPLSIIDFDGLELYGVSDSRLTYNIQLMTDGISDDHSGLGKYEAIVSYSSTQTHDLAGATAGVENADGTLGLDASSSITAGGQLCYDAIKMADSYQVTFQVIPNESYIGQAAAPALTVESDMQGTTELTFEGESVELVNAAPVANAGADATYDRSAMSEVPLSASSTLDVDGDLLSYKWSQTGGESITLYGSNSIYAHFDADDTTNGSYTFSLTVSDGEYSSTDEVTITIEGEKAGGSGSLGFIALLLGLPLFFRRKRLS